MSTGITAEIERLITHPERLTEGKILDMLEMIQDCRIPPDYKSKIGLILEDALRKLRDPFRKDFHHMEDYPIAVLRRWTKANSQTPNAGAWILLTLGEVMETGSMDLQATQPELAERASVSVRSVKMVFKEWESIGALVRNPKGSKWRWRVNPNFVHKLDARQAAVEQHKHRSHIRLLELRAVS